MSRVLILTERFHPEEFLVNDLASEWKKRGYEVEVLTQAPSYPFDRLFDGYRNRFSQTTVELNGIPVHRVSTVLGYNRSVRRKIWNYLHFAWRTFWWAVWHGRKYGRIFIYHTGPLTMATAAIAFRYAWRRRCSIWTQDLWPDAVYAYGFKFGAFRRFLLHGFVRLVYSCCETIAVSCRGFVGRIQETTGREAMFIPQWDVGTPELPPKAPGDKVVFLFAGNLGVPQALPNVIDGFAKARLANAELHLVGGGVMLGPLKERAAKLGVDGIVFHGRQPRGRMPAFFEQADVLVISLCSDFRLTLPGKFQSYLKAGRPLLGILHGDVREMILSENLGAVADPDDVDEIAKGFSRLAAREARMQASLQGANAQRLSRERFARELLVGRLTGMVAARFEQGGVYEPDRSRRG